MDETGPANSPVPEGVEGSRGEKPPAPAGVGELRDPAPPAVTLSGGSAAPPAPIDERAPLTQPSRREPSGAFLSHLQSLRELQITLSQEGRPEAILIEGTTGTVEIVGADCAVALVEPSNGLAPLRFGWIEGRHMAQHEIAVVSRRLDEAIEKVRSGQTTRVVLGAGVEAGEATPTAAGAANGSHDPGRMPRFGATLVLGISAAMGSRGALVLARHEPVPFSREQALLADILSSLMAIQVERALRATDARRASERLQEECLVASRRLQETSQELAALNAIAAAASPSLDLDRQIEASLRKALEVTGFKVGAISLVEDAGGSEVLRYARGVGDPAFLELAQARPLGRGEGVAGGVWAVGEPLAFADLSEASYPEGCAEELGALRRSGYRALACVPLRARGRIIGTMQLLSSDARPELSGRPSMAQAIAGQIAIVIQNARLLSELMRHSLELEAEVEKATVDLGHRDQVLEGVLASVQAASRSTDLREVAEEALARALAIVGMEAGAVHLVEPGTRSLQLKAQHGLSQRALDELGPRVGRSIIGRTFETGEPQVCMGAPADVLDAETRLRVQAAVPLRALSGIHGVLSVAGTDDRVLRGPETRALRALGELLGLSVENARAFQQTGRPPKPAADLPAQLVLAQKMESVGTLAGGIAHEFNNILGAILGYASHIESLTTSDNPIHRQALTIGQQARRAAELTQQLLAFAWGGQYTLEPVDMNQAIADTVSLLSKSVDPRIGIEVRTDADLPAVEADTGQMQQVLANVAVNAAEAMPEGGKITFETRVAHLDEAFARSHPDVAPGDFVEVVIGDTGVGMPPDVADRVFEPFFTTKTDGDATGLGLSVVYGIVKNHRGHVALTSTPGLGTTVRIYLPVFSRSLRSGASPAAVTSSTPPAPAGARAAPPRRPLIPHPFQSVSVVPESERRRDRAPRPGEATPLVGADRTTPPPTETRPAAPPPAPRGAVATTETARPMATPASTPVLPLPLPGPAPRKPAAGHAAAKTPARGRILVVDDEAAIREMARDILESNGYEVVLATDGVDALEVYRNEWGRIDLVLLDMVMPRMGGLETFRRIAGMDRSLRVLLCSGYADNDKAQRALKEGALGLLSKPFTMTELLGRIDKLIARR